MDALEIETERLLLRDYRPDDAEEAIAIYADPEVMRFLGGVDNDTVEKLRAWLAEVSVKYAGYRSRGLPYCALAAFEKRTGALIGTTMFKPLPDAEKVDTAELEVGWHVVRRCWGHGYATEMGAAMLEHGFTATGIESLHAVIDPGNTPSVHVAQRLGMRLVETTERFYGRSLLDHVISRDEWRGGAR